MAVRSADTRSHPTAPSDGSGSVGLAALGVVALAAAALADPATIEDGPVICPFRLITGLPCPGCGLTRAWVYIVHGHWGDAVDANPFGYLALGVALAFIVIVGLAIVRGTPMPSPTPLLRSTAFKVVVAGWLVFAVIRIVVVATGHASA